MPKNLDLNSQNYGLNILKSKSIAIFYIFFWARIAAFFVTLLPHDEFLNTCIEFPKPKKLGLDTQIMILTSSNQKLWPIIYIGRKSGSHLGFKALLCFARGWQIAILRIRV